VRRLVTIPISHYCEKARWALERAGVGYVEERHVQGVHQIAARRAGGGSTVPVLVAPEGVLAESEEILLYADERLPEESRLFPADPALRREVDELSRWLDAGLGPDGRRLMYTLMLPHKRLMLLYNNQGVPAWEARFLIASWPVVKRWAGRHLGIGRDTAREDEANSRRAFEVIAERLSDGRPYLCGDRFTAADVTFAALSAALTVPPEYGVTLPQPEVLPEPIARLIRTFREHPAGSYALRIFREERRRPALGAEVVGQAS
jgi:glutathione S-transferase